MSRISGPDEGDMMLLIAFQWISVVDGCVSLKIGVHLKERLASEGSWLIGEFLKLFMNCHFIWVIIIIKYML